MVRKTNSRWENLFPEFISAPDKIYNIFEFMRERPYSIRFRFRHSQRFLQAFEFPDFGDTNEKFFEYHFDKHFFIKTSNCLNLLEKDYSRAKLPLPEIDVVFLNKTKFHLLSLDRDFFKEETKTSWLTSFMKRFNFERKRI